MPADVRPPAEAVIVPAARLLAADLFAAGLLAADLRTVDVAP